MRTTIKIDRTEALDLFQATMAYYEELQSKRDKTEYGTREYANYCNRINRLLDIQTKLVNFYTED